MVIDFLVEYGEWIILAGFAAYIIFFDLPWLQNLLIKSREPDSPVLISGELLANSGLQSMHTGEFQGYKYNFLYNGSRVMALVQLGFNTNIHVVATGDRAGNPSLLPFSSKWLTRVELEGDFPTYFKMYCSKDKEVELLTIFDPTDMAYFVDFCRSHNFEIFHDTLYISQIDSASDDSDTTSLVTDINNFLQKNDRTLRKL